MLLQSLPRYFWGVFAFYLSAVLLCPCPDSTVGLLPECQAEGWLDVVRTGLLQQNTLMLRGLESRFPWQSPCLALIFFDMCALSKLIIHCHQCTAFSLHYCFKQSSKYDSICCILQSHSEVEGEPSQKTCLKDGERKMYVLSSKYVLGIY